MISPRLSRSVAISSISGSFEEPSSTAITSTFMFHSGVAASSAASNWRNNSQSLNTGVMMASEGVSIQSSEINDGVAEILIGCLVILAPLSNMPMERHIAN